jgi:hypothetical protein
MKSPSASRVLPLTLVLCVAILWLTAPTARAACRIVNSDWLVSAMARAGHPVAKYHGQYATREQCMAALRQAVAQSGDPSLANHMSCECSGGTPGPVGGFSPPMTLPTTDQQAMANVFGLMLQGMTNGSSANDQAAQQQDLLLQQQAAEKQKAEMLDKQRAAAAGTARSTWDSQDADHQKALGEMFGPPPEKRPGLSPLLQKQATLQLQGMAGPVDETSPETIRKGGGVGFDEPAETPAGAPAVSVPEPPDPMPVQSMEPADVTARIKEAKALLARLDKDLEKAREKHGQVKTRLEKAIQDQAERKAKAQSPDNKQADEALLAELEAEEVRIEALAREMDESSERVEDLEGQKDKKTRDLEMWNAKLEPAHTQ